MVLRIILLVHCLLAATEGVTHAEGSTHRRHRLVQLGVASEGAVRIEEAISVDCQFVFELFVVVLFIIGITFIIIVFLFLYTIFGDNRSIIFIHVLITTFLQ